MHAKKLFFFRNDACDKVTKYMLSKSTSAIRNNIPKIKETKGAYLYQQIY